jgi:hypothetical protein
MKKHHKSDRRGFESLEDRRLMTVNILLTSAGILKLTGNSDNDQVVVSVDKRGTTSTADDRVVVKVDSWNDTVSSSASKSYKASSVKSIEFHGNAGGDMFKNLTNFKSLAYGGSGMDALIGGTNDDTLDGGVDADYIDGRLGNDHIYGGDGDDILAGDKGDDIINAGLGNDYLYGGDGKDGLNGQQGNDWLDGGAGTEFKMLGGTGTDYFYDGTLSFPGGDYKARASEGDKGFTGHPNLGAVDMNFADDNVRWQKRWDTMLATDFPVIPTFVPTPTQDPTPPPPPKQDPPPPPPKQDPPAVVDYNAKVLAFAQGAFGTKVGSGQCADLAVAALAAAGAKPGSNFQSQGLYVWGQAVSVAQAKAGDIIQFFPGTTFKTTNPDGSWFTNTFGSTSDPQHITGHTAIIESVNGSVITMLQQNVNGQMFVQRATLDLSTIQPSTNPAFPGGFQIYQPIPA